MYMLVQLYQFILRVFESGSREEIIGQISKST